jgi:predicted DNA-binding protein (MmcQ/YjbR family)
MDIESFRDYCINKKHVTEEFPFGDSTLVLKVGGKMFALANLDGEFSINLKCDPERAFELRENFTAIVPGYHMNKKHWNTIYFDGSIPVKLVKELIDHSYDLVLNSLPRNTKTKLGF